MVTTFNKTDMIDFGRFLLSKERRAAFEATQEHATTPLEDRLGDVHAADFKNWMETRSSNSKPDRKPKQGDTVIYHPGNTKSDDPLRANGLDQCTALVTQTWDSSEDMITLVVFDWEGNIFCRSSVGKRPEGTICPNGTWSFK